MRERGQLQTIAQRASSRSASVWACCAWVVGAVLAGTLCAPAVGWAEDGGVLPLVTVREEGQAPRFWWGVTQGKPQLSTVERGIVDALSAPGLSGIDPARAGAKVRISSVYRRPGLAATNAAQLGGLWGADAVVVGDITLTSVEAASGFEPGVRVRVRLSVVGVARRDTIAEIELERAAYGQGARRAALAQSADAVGAWVARALAQRSAAGEVTRSGEPFVVLRGVRALAGLEAAQEALGRVDGVSRVRVAWMARGAVALDVNPGQDDAVSALRAWVERAASASAARGFALRLRPGQDRVDVDVVERDAP